MSAPRRTTFSELSHEAAVALLERNRFGRLAFTLHDRVDIEPISYVYHDGWLYARTSPGAKLTTVLHHPWVAFEVDEIHDGWNWKSVVARGTIYFLDADAAGAPRDAYDSALRLIRSADPDALTGDDPVPHRAVLFRIHADEITGRAASSESSS